MHFKKSPATYLMILVEEKKNEMRDVIPSTLAIMVEVGL